MLSNARRQMLTEELLKECWHDIADASTAYPLRCSKCGNAFQNVLPENVNKSFNVLNDMKVIKEKLVERGDWEKFIRFAFDRWRATAPKHFPYFDDWLYRPMDKGGRVHFCLLVAEWMDETKESKGGVKDGRSN